jgi:predicted Zn-dependent peptidase
MVILKDHFKSYIIHISVGHLFQKEMDVFSILLDQYLKASHPSYTSRKAISIALEEMYGLKVSLYTSLEGNYLVHHLRVKMIQPQLVLEKSLLKEVVDFIIKMLFHSNIDDEKRFYEEKSRLIHQYELIKDDKQSYIDYLYEEVLQKKTLDVYSIDEKINLLRSATLKDIKNYYEQVFKVASVITFATGAFPDEDIIIIKDAFEPYEKGMIKPIFQKYPLHEKELHQLKMPINQAILHLGYMTNVTYKDSKMTALQIFNELLGGHASSRLFHEIREKRGLCYSIYSYLNLNQGLLSISTGVDMKRLDETKQAIYDVLESLKKDDINDEELIQAKDFMIHQIQTSLDRQSVYIQRAYRNHIHEEQYDLEERLIQINDVTKEDIKWIANHMSLVITHQVLGETQ